ncbi:NAD(P)/FAD-dependent oxidoreductase [Mycobacterium sp. CVI_P3]|uniref:Pyridine nucleotide-disulfide oxidoreductase domain-containing protein 2 n=1 Tax=Mycobacterium pinniadriaticum TaxID=2994102 RepID=A0ABT3S9Z1_9MYCO|nr:NAD(P)/FAD-dependent oxidoreductase [Mycobacterium pinniadriaticum]MCX2930048.1 NAD(P)/FAD-dependent oxidoreductase [Mycobacterium pinniadriaticum]MCX2936303.1 NAD(P)/FAD-dependent oxidoreductase [Mycobacterium pinniadriaticum]
MTYDAIIVGGGHHGLTCASYLAKAGKRVVVLERNPWLGGMAYSRETVAQAPGFVMNPCAVDLLFTNLEPSIITELQLESFGLRQASPEPWGSYLGPAGESIGLWRSLDRTVDEIRRYSKRDATKFAELCGMWCDFWYVAAPYLMDHPTRPRARTIAELGWRVLRKRKSLAPVVRMLMASPHQLIETLFESEEVKTLLAVYASGSEAPLREPGSGAVLGVIMMHIGWGIKRPIGGMAEFTKALAACLHHHGGETRTDAAVEEIIVRDGAASGVRLRDGQTLFARQVIGAVDPVTLMCGLVDSAHVAEPVLDELRNIRINGWGINNAKIDVALDHRPGLLCDRPELWGSYMLIADDRSYVDRALDGAMRGVLPAETPMWALMPSAADRSQVPAGSAGDTMYLFCTAVPDRFADGSDWEEHRAPFADQAVRTFDGVAPGFADAVIGSWVKSPNELRQMTHDGSYVVVDMSLNQMGPNRPTPALSGYRTPIPGLWHTGAGAHPMGGVHGWAGRTTARQVLKSL